MTIRKCNRSANIKKQQNHSAAKKDHQSLQKYCKLLIIKIKFIALMFQKLYLAYERLLYPAMTHHIFSIRNKAPAGCAAHKELVIQRAWEISQQAGNAQICRSRNERFSHMARHMHCLRLLSQQGLWAQMHCLPVLYQIWYKSRKQCICIYKCEKPSILLSWNEWFFCLLRRCPKPQ